MFNDAEKYLIQQEIKKLLKKRVIKECTNEQKEYVSPIFSENKSDGNIRMILNLKKVNKCLKYEHFKMDSIQTVLQNVTPNCFMASLDLKDAYYSVKIDEEFQSFLKFSFEGKLYKYVCFPNGLGPCPRKFTKLNKPLLSFLRTENHIVIGYLDDFFLEGLDFEQCKNSVLAAVVLFDSVGYVVHPTKSNFIPSQIIKFLGFVVNSIDMSISLPEEKQIDIKNMALDLIQSRRITIRKLACFIGKIIATFPASTYGPLHFRTLESFKTFSLQRNRMKFDEEIELTPECKHECIWWKDNIENMKKNILLKPISCEIYSDASSTGWGCHLKKEKYWGLWDPSEKHLHINVLELKAILHALEAFSHEITGLHIKVFSDNMTAVASINKMGTSHSAKCNTLTKTIWALCEKLDTWITCAHIPGKQNILADALSRKSYDGGEAMLSKDILNRAISEFNFDPDIDCFASKYNKQFKKYISRYPDKHAFIIDAFTIDWSHYNCYLFPPFSQISKVLQKIRNDQATALVVLPRWPTQAWFPMAQKMMVQKPVVVAPSEKNLTIRGNPHPFAAKMNLIISVLSGKLS